MQAADNGQGRGGSQPHPPPATILMGGSMRDRQVSKLSPSCRASSGLSCSTAIGALHRAPVAGWSGLCSMGQPPGCAELSGATPLCSPCSQQGLLCAWSQRGAHTAWAQAGRGVYLDVAVCDVVSRSYPWGPEQCCDHGPQGWRMPLVPLRY